MVVSWGDVWSYPAPWAGGWRASGIWGSQVCRNQYGWSGWMGLSCCSPASLPPARLVLGVDEQQYGERVVLQCLVEGDALVGEPAVLQEDADQLAVGVDLGRPEDS